MYLNGATPMPTTFCIHMHTYSSALISLVLQGTLEALFKRGFIPSPEPTEAHRGPLLPEEGPLPSRSPHLLVPAPGAQGILG